MSSKNLSFDCFDVLGAKRVYSSGGNVTDYLREQKKISYNTSDIIEIAYDLQAGTYVDAAEKNMQKLSLYVNESLKIINTYMTPGQSLLDIGTGELTTLSLLMRGLSETPKQIYAFDISWSRVYKGIDFSKKYMGDKFAYLTPFIADICKIPLMSKSIDICLTSHALEPNGKNLNQLLKEIFRVARKYVILFEPCYEINTKEGKARMDKLGYIKGIEDEVLSLGGILVDKIPIENTNNPLNPTVCFVIDVEGLGEEKRVFGNDEVFSVPGTDYKLSKTDDVYFSNETGLVFPILKSIPVLKPGSAILSSALVSL